MNVYILVEGKTERKVYPKWVEQLIPSLERADSFDKVEDNNYFIFSSEGYPSIKSDIITAIEDINSINTYNYLLVCLDTDDMQVSERIKEIEDHITNNHIKCHAKVIIIPQKRCMETWFLGNRRVFSRQPQGQMCKYRNFYDVSINDPEIMTKCKDFDESISKFHAHYLKSMLAVRDIKYLKDNPKAVCQNTYLEELLTRIKDTSHLETFRNFINVCNKLIDELE